MVKSAILFLSLWMVPTLVSAQPVPAAPAKPDSDAVKALIEKAKKVGGPMWAGEEHFFCEAPPANSPNDPPIEPAKVFDNVYVIATRERWRMSSAPPMAC